MTITYTWKIKGIKARNTESFENIVVQTYWEKTGTDENGNTGTFQGATPFSAENIDPDSFIPYNQLTEQTVLGWIQSVVTDSYEEHVNKQIQKQIEQKINAINEVDMPWATESAQ